MASPAHALIVADGAVDAVALVTLAAAPVGGGEAPLIVAADGGAARCLAAGVRPDIVVGDFDSLAAADQRRLAELGVELQAADPAKDESDMELCLLLALGAGMTRITIIGALGIVRPEHSIANLLLLADPRLDEVEVAIVGHGSRVWRIGTQDGPGETAITGAAGDYVSLFTMGARVDGVRTEGLRFPLRDEALLLGPSRGLSNELLSGNARVTTQRGCLLVVHTDGPVADAQVADAQVADAQVADARTPPRATEG